MRFAISLLVVLAALASIGTLLPQNGQEIEATARYGRFWQQLFAFAGLFDIFHASSFLLLLFFLLLSICLCLWRHTPTIWQGFWQDNAMPDPDFLRSQACHWEGKISCDLHEALKKLKQRGFTVKINLEKSALIAQKGRIQRLGYVLTHAAMVIVCLGGMIDGNIALKMAEFLGYRHPETRDIPADQVPAISRLEVGAHAFRGNLFLPEAGNAQLVFVNSGTGYYVQELPFIIHLKQLSIEHYPSGQPKRFVSDIEILEKRTNKVLRQAQVEVNKPLIQDGIAIYQASFGDGGSPLAFQLHALDRTTPAQIIQTRSQSSQSLQWQGKNYQLELGEFHLFNIEAKESAPQVSGLTAALQRMQQVKAASHTLNLGPSIQFTVRDNANQAVEFLNYLAPYSEDGKLYQLTGSRHLANEPFRFTRIPLDQEASPATFLRLRATLLDPDLREEIARRTVAKAEAGGGVSPQAKAQFQVIVMGALDQFAKGGFPAIDHFLEEKVPEAQRPMVAQTYIKVMQGAIIDAMDLAQDRAGLAPIAVDEKQYRFLLDSLVATSSLMNYGAPFWLQLDRFDEVKASGLQVSRAPGQTLVYLGLFMLLAGIYCQFYLKARRCWLLHSENHVLIALNSSQKNADLKTELAELLDALQRTSDG